MKKGFYSVLLVLMSTVFSVTVDGYAFLEGETDHSGVEVLFQRVVPDTLVSYAVYTDSIGYYSSDVEDGWYDIFYSKSGFVSKDTADVALYSNQTLPDKTLLLSNPITYELSGPLKGTLTAGEYTVTNTIYVEEGDSLIIQPGVVLNFNTDKEFIIFGILNAEGTAGDSIIFNNCKTMIINDTDLVYNSANVSLKYCSLRSNLDIKIFPGASGDINISHSYIKTNGIRMFGHDSVKFDTVVINGCFDTYMHNNKLTLKNSIISTSSVGVFMHSARSTCLVENSLIKSGIAGIVSWGDSGAIEIDNSIIISESSGGEDDFTTITPFKSSLKIYNSKIIAKNSSAISSKGGSVKIFNSIINAKIYGIESPGGPLEIANCNVQGESQNFYNCGPYLGVNVTTNANGDPCDAYGNISMDPKFVDPVNGNFRLQADSPCIDAGTNTISDYEFPLADLDGNYRIWDGNSDSNAIVDMGAYEYGAISVGIENNEVEISNSALYQNYPNPFNPVTSISYALPEAAQVELNVYNLQGQMVKSLVSGKMGKGVHKAEFNGADLTTGIYIYSLKVDNKVVQSKKMMLLK